MDNRFIKIIAINILILFACQALVALMFHRDEIMHFGILEDTMLSFLLICIQFLANFIKYWRDNSTLRFSFLLSAFLILLIGAGICAKKFPFYGF